MTQKGIKKQTESQIQTSCIEWFRIQYPDLQLLLFAVPNGGKRGPATGAIMKREGAISGVSDLILLIPKKGFASLCIEMKRPGGKQSENQKEWEGMATKAKNKYVVCYSVQEFSNEVNAYLR